MPPDLRLVALNAKALGIWYNPQRIAHDHLLQSERTAGVTIGDIFVPPSLREPSYALNSSRIGMVAAGPLCCGCRPPPPTSSRTASNPPSIRSPSVNRRTRGNLSSCGISQRSRPWHNCQFGVGWASPATP